MRADKHISASLWDAPFGLSLFSHAQTPKIPSFCSLFLTSFLIFLFATSFSYSQTTGHSNVTISDAATVNGVWSGSNSEGWVFTPTSDNANVLASEIESKIRSGNVSITTVNSSGTQLGSVYVDTEISGNNYSSSRSHILDIDVPGIIEVNDKITMLTYLSYDTNSVKLKALGDVLINSSISTSGGSVNFYYNRSLGVRSSGDIEIISGGLLKLNASLSATGSYNTYNHSTYGYGTNGGQLRLVGAGGVLLNSDISTLGGGSISDRSGSAGSIEISTGHGVVTEGGVNDGQVSGVITGGNFTKSGSGVLQLTGSNAWTGSTTVSEGTLQMGSSGSIPNNRNLTVNSVLDLNGQNYLSNSFSGSGRVTSGVVGDVLLTVSNSGTFSGLLEDGSGRLSFKKTGGTNFTLSGNNTYSGLTTVNTSGYLSIAHSNALGATSSGTVVGNNGTLDISGDISVGVEALSLTGDGYTTNKGALHNSSGSNTWSGTIDLQGSNRVYVTVADGSSLSLEAASSITSSDNTPLSFYIWGDMDIKGVIAHGSGVLEKYRDGTLSLEGNNTYSGTTTVGDGILKISHNNALGDVSGATTVSSGASLALEGGISVGAEPITITGSGHDSDTGALTSLSGDNSYGGLITISNASIHTSSDTLTLDGSTAISATSARNLTFTGAGDLWIEGQVSLPSNSKIILDSDAHLKMGASDVLSSTIDLEFNGGSFYTQGYNNELDQLILTEDSDLVLGTGSHTLRFTEAGAFNFRKLRIKDWSGTYGGSGASGSAGKVYVTADVNREKLDQMSFYNSSDSKDYYALQLESQEVVSGDDRLGTPTGHSNVRITDLATVNGVWSGSNSEGWVFTPTSDNANVLASEIESKIRSGNVSITTVNSSGTQLGSVYVDTEISGNNYSSSRSHILDIDVPGIIEVNDKITMLTYLSYDTNSVKLKALGDVLINSSISTSGGSVNFYYNRSLGVRSSGDIEIISGGLLKLNASLSATGSYNTYNHSTYGYGTNGGQLRLVGAGGVLLNSDISTLGGGSISNSSGSAGSIEISTGHGVVTEGGVNDGQVSGVITGGNFTKSGSGLLQLTGSNTWTGYTDMSAGTLTLASVNALPSSRNIVFSGGELQTYGQSKSFGTLGLTANSTLQLGSTDHTITFSNKGSMGAYLLTVKGWEGTYGSTGSSGTDGKLKINVSLNSTDLAKIRFYNSSDGKYYEALQLSTKEIVPGLELP